MSGRPMANVWRDRREPAGTTPFARTQRICPSCWHVYTPGSYRAHLRGWMHKERRGWWR